jgi:hypothetical protein
VRRRGLSGSRILSLILPRVQGTPFTQQKYKLASLWPESWVKEQWNEARSPAPSSSSCLTTSAPHMSIPLQGYRITELATIDDEWMVILSKVRTPASLLLV